MAENGVPAHNLGCCHRGGRCHPAKVKTNNIVHIQVEKLNIQEANLTEMIHWRDCPKCRRVQPIPQDEPDATTAGVHICPFPQGGDSQNFTEWKPM